MRYQKTRRPNRPPLCLHHLVRQGHRLLKLQRCLHPLSVLSLPLFNWSVHLIHCLLSHITSLNGRNSQFRPLPPFIFSRPYLIHVSLLQQPRHYHSRCVIRHRRLKTTRRPLTMETLLIRPSHPRSQTTRGASFAKKPSWSGLSRLRMISTPSTNLRAPPFSP